MASLLDRWKDLFGNVFLWAVRTSSLFFPFACRTFIPFFFRVGAFVFFCPFSSTVTYLCIVPACRPRWVGVSRVVGIRYSSTLAVTRSRHALTLYIPSSHTIHSLVRALSPSVRVCVRRCRWARQPPATCPAEGASEALARGFVPGLLLAFSPLLLPSNRWVVFDHYCRRSCYPQPSYPSVTPCIHF